jgi:MFS family permease
MSPVPLSIRFILRNKALRYKNFRKYLLTRFSLIMALNMQTTIIVYWVYTVTSDVATVGMMGLFEAIPAIGCSLFSGHFVDQREKRNLILACLAGYVALTGYFIFIGLPSSHFTEDKALFVRLIYAGIFIGGALRAFVSPSSFALMGMLIPRKLYTNGSTWSSTSWQLGAVLGPLIGGMLIAFLNISVSLCVALGLLLVAMLATSRIPMQEIMQKVKEPVWESLRQGMSFVFNTQIILAVLALDMFAVLFGGAVALLPVYARDILKVGEIGFGWLRAAPGIGSIIMYFILAWMPLKNKPGIKLLLSITGFGACIIIFGLSREIADFFPAVHPTRAGARLLLAPGFFIAFAALLFSGIFDAVSVVIRGTLLQLHTPDAMRGRVAAVNTMFISSSNELGEVESGFVAKWLGTVPSVVAGGCVTFAVVVVTYFAAPLLKTIKLEAPEEKKKES